MSEDVFRIVVAISVLAAIAAFVAQCAAGIALYRVTRRMRQDSAGFLARLELLFRNAEPLFHRLEPIIEKSEQVIDSCSSAAAKARSGIDRLAHVPELTSDAFGRVDALRRDIGEMAATTRQIVEDLRPVASQVSGDVRAILRSGRTAAQDGANLLQTMRDRMRSQLNQIDRAVDREHKITGDAPVRQILETTPSR